MCAGEELAIPATKTTIASFCAVTALIEACRSGKNKNILKRLPDELYKGQALTWSSIIARLKKFDSLIVISRGLGLTLAQETALKFKEACGISAEAFSSAEFKHGPQAIVSQGTPILLLAQAGKEMNSILEMAKALKDLKANVILAAPSGVRARDVTMPAAASAETGIICAAQSIYLMIEELARTRGLNPDSPEHLQKITKTM
jgi:glucosamine--fructose-6-phosphate aminotransferase (isomerizing)